MHTFKQIRIIVMNAKQWLRKINKRNRRSIEFDSTLRLIRCYRTAMEKQGIKVKYAQ